MEVTSQGRQANLYVELLRVWFLITHFHAENTVCYKDAPYVLFGFIRWYKEDGEKKI
jgi:hypothetical protein